MTVPARRRSVTTPSSDGGRNGSIAAEPARTFRREDLVAAVWGEPWVGDAHAADVHVANLRRKLGDDAAAPRFVRTVRGVGYRIGPA